MHEKLETWDRNEGWIIHQTIFRADPAAGRNCPTTPPGATPSATKRFTSTVFVTSSRTLSHAIVKRPDFFEIIETLSQLKILKHRNENLHTEATMVHGPHE